MIPDSPTILLVPGAFHGAWCWEQVLVKLEHAGVNAFAIDLPGHGDDPGPFTDLAGDADRLWARIDELDAPVILVGHSYAGVVITRAGAHPSVSHLVYIAAFAVTEDESAAAAATAEADAAHLSHKGRIDLGAGFVSAEDGTATVQPEVAAAAFYNDCDAADVAWALARIEPQLLASLSQSPGSAAWRRVPSTYVICEDDAAVHPGLQEIIAKRCSRSVRWPTGHSPFLSDPTRVATFLDELATR